MSIQRYDIDSYSECYPYYKSETGDFVDFEDHQQLVDKLNDKLQIDMEALQKIAEEDFRGNRPQANVDALNVLKKIEEIK